MTFCRTYYIKREVVKGEALFPSLGTFNGIYQNLDIRDFGGIISEEKMRGFKKMEKVVVCPYCDRSYPHPKRPGVSRGCACGAVYALVHEEELGAGVANLVGGLFEESTLSLSQLLSQCQITVFRGSELPQDRPRGELISEFIKEIRFEPEPEAALDLVWITRNKVEVAEADLIGQG